jgi:hypothetical protein
MTADAISPSAKPANWTQDSFAGLMLAAGAATLFLGTLAYARLSPVLGLPAPAAEHAQALSYALALDPEKLALAGGLAFAGDCLLLAASIVLVVRAGARSDALGLVGWSLLAVSVAVALVFDSMMAALFSPLAHGADPAPFLAVKAWFDFLFAAGDVPYGVGFVAILWADLLSDAPLLPRPATYAGLAVGAAAAISGLGAAAGVFHLPLVIGLSVTFGCLLLTALGIRLAWIRQPDSAGFMGRPAPTARA